MPRTLVAAAVLLTRWRQAYPAAQGVAPSLADAVLPQALAATLDRTLQRDGARRAAPLAMRGRLERLGDKRFRGRIEMVRADAGEPQWSIDAEFDAATLQQRPTEVARQVA